MGHTLMGDGVDGNTKIVDTTVIVEMISRLGEDDLFFLNHDIIDRFNLIRQAKSTSLLACFYVGARIRFCTHEGQNKTGVIIKLNQKTASIQTDDGGRWKVSPALLTMIKDA